MNLHDWEKGYTFAPEKSLEKRIYVLKKSFKKCA